MEMLKIETERLLLRSLQPEDLEDVFEICSDEQGCLDDGGFHAYKVLNTEFCKLFELFLTQCRYAVVLKDGKKLIGLINIMEADRAVEARELGFNFNHIYRRKGYAYEALSALIQMWFEKTDVEMFTARHFVFNTASEKLITKLGFVCEGQERKALYHAVKGPCDVKCWYLEK